MTIPDVGRCQGSGKPPLADTEQSQGGVASGICVACSGRFHLEDGVLVEHEAAPDDEREQRSES